MRLNVGDLLIDRSRPDEKCVYEHVGYILKITQTGISVKWFYNPPLADMIVEIYHHRKRDITENIGDLYTLISKH